MGSRSIGNFMIPPRWSKKLAMVAAALIGTVFASALGFSVPGAGATTPTNVVAALTSLANGAASQYTLTFTTTAALVVGGSPSTITLSDSFGAQGATFPMFASDYTVNNNAVTVLPTGTTGNVT